MSRRRTGMSVPPVSRSICLLGRGNVNRRATGWHERRHSA
jgi:hypothetical protein